MTRHLPPDLVRGVLSRGGTVKQFIGVFTHEEEPGNSVDRPGGPGTAAACSPRTRRRMR
jgi:hypothetical protein